MRLLVFACLVTSGLCMPGGWSKEDLTDAATKQKFMDMLTMLSDAPSTGTKQNLALVSLPQDVQLVGVKTQVVAGMNYNFTISTGGQTCSFVYFEQVWTDIHQITSDSCNVMVVPSSPPPMCAGCAMKQDPTDMQYMTNLMALVPLPANGVTINSVSTQVVAGIKYMYDLTVAGRHCLLDYVDQAWMKTQTVTKDTCNLSGHTKRQLLTGVRSGGYAAQDPTLPKWTEMISSLQRDQMLYINANSDVKILSVSQQVVSGMNYKFTITVDGRTCTFVYFTQSWTNTQKISEDTCHLHMAPDRRQLGLLGGWRAASDSDNDGVQKCLTSSLDMVNARSNSMFRMVESNVQAMVKTVQGMEYKLTFQTMESSCMQSTDSQGLTSTSCPAKGTSSMGTWQAVCWSRPWLQDGEAFKVTSLNMM